MKLERIKVVAKVPGDITQPLRIEQREDLVILSPQFAQPLHRQRLRRHHQTALDLFNHRSLGGGGLGMDQAIEDQRRLDGFTEADFVGQQPTNRVGSARAFRDVKLVGEQPHASAQERAQAIGLANRQQVQDVHPCDEVINLVEITRDQLLEQGAFELKRPQRVRGFGAAVGQPEQPIGQHRGDRRLFVSGRDSDRSSRTQVHRNERISVRRQPQRGR